MQVEYDGVKSRAVTVPIQQSQPAIFSLDASGAGPGAILNQDYSVKLRDQSCRPRICGDTLRHRGGAD
jgi:uncharacterized protein (TIGR03437 family)